jgi:hypothetical protein
LTTIASQQERIANEFIGRLEKGNFGEIFVQINLVYAYTTSELAAILKGKDRVEK